MKSFNSIVLLSGIASIAISLLFINPNTSITVADTYTDYPSNATPSATPSISASISATPTFTVTPTPECDGQICVIVDCPGQGECEVVIGNTPTPTLKITPTATPSATQQPTPTATSAPHVGGSSENPTPTPGSVQGAVTLAPTGDFSFANMGVLFGSLLTSASVLYRLKKS